MSVLVFSSVPFLYGFLPLVLLLYYVVPQRLKNVVLLLASLFFYFYGEPVYCIVMVASALLGYVFGLLIDKYRTTRAAKPLLWVAAACSLAPLLFFKYSDFFLMNLNAFIQPDLPLLKIALPIGISFYTFQILSYLLDVARGDARVQRNPIGFVTYVTLFPQLIAGPIVRYQTVQDEIDRRSHTLVDFSTGITRFCVGLGKKVLIADALAALSAQLGGSVLSHWLASVIFTLQIYFDFSGYSDMAIGLGRLFGFHFSENFDHPYTSGSVTEFWRRWHISLGSWFRDYVYIPLGGNRCGKGKWICNIAIVWFLTGFWHGAAWNFIFWGLYFAIFLLAEKLFYGKALTRLPRGVQVLYTLVIVNFGFLLFNSASTAGFIASIGAMFGAGGLSATDPSALYVLRSNLVSPRNLSISSPR